MTEQETRYAYSKLTDTWYKVTDWKWINKEKGQMKTYEKEEVKRENVPEKWLGAVDEREQ